MGEGGGVKKWSKTANVIYYPSVVLHCPRLASNPAFLTDVNWALFSFWTAKILPPDYDSKIVCNVT